MPATTGLLEREDELATIEAILDAARNGSGRLLLIEGEAGAGKTTLLAAAANLAAERELLLLRAGGGEYERDFPYGVVRQLLEPILADEARRAELLSGSAILAAPVFEPEAASGDGRDPFSIQHGLYWLLADLAESAPLVLLVDDAQWADVVSLRALAYLARRLGDLPIALALAVRSGERGEHTELLGALRREPQCELIVPPPLSREASATLVVGELGRQPSERFTEACRDATRGNPFLLVELLRALGADGTDPGDESAERLTRVAAIGVSRAILTRLGQLGSSSVEVAQAIAVLEPNAEVRLIAALAELTIEQAAGACARLVAARLLTDSRPLAFVHPLVRAAVLSDMPEPQRAIAHARAARLLAEDGADPDTVAAQLMLAEPSGDEWASGELRAAAAAALDRAAADAAVRYLRRALREPPPRKERLATSRELGMALLRANDAEGVEVLRAVRSALSDPAERAEIAADLALSFAVRWRSEEAVAMMKESLAEVADPCSKPGVKLRGSLLMVVLWGHADVPEGALPAPGETFDVRTPEGRTIMAMSSLLSAFGLRSVEGARETAEATLAEAAWLEADWAVGLNPTAALVTLVLTDRGDAVGDYFKDVVEIAKRRGTVLGISGSHGIRCYCHLLDGELRDAQAEVEIALRVSGQFGFSVALSSWLGAAVRTLIARGELVRAEELLDEIWRDRELPGGIPGALLLYARGELRLATGRSAEARHDFLATAERVRFLPYANPEVLGWRTGLALCESALGNSKEARELAAEAVELAREAGGPRGLGIAMRVQGAIAEGVEGIELLREAADLLATTRARLQRAYALADLGAALRRANRRRESREPLREALDLAHRCGATPLEERARTELAATGARPRKAVISGVESLTPSELRIARMAAEGMTNREIAQALTVTAKTVETHLRHVFQKLDIARRTELPDALTSV
ncbi:MAG TPA: AAA family ATPase [Solirubrobacterales bacterium]|jgi:DNA-binding NarL/FixJ family response regulator|nr:AAA family ATPase [Solirubrobacterales bacterium]